MLKKMSGLPNKYFTMGKIRAKQITQASINLEDSKTTGQLEGTRIFGGQEKQLFFTTGTDHTS